MKKILIVDDEEKTRNSLRRFLTISNFEIIEASNGLEALDVYAANSVDLVITDIMMPEMDGLELIQKLREQHGHVKVIVTSGVFDIEGICINCLEHARRIGADIVLEKPFSSTALLVSINKLLN